MLEMSSEEVAAAEIAAAAANCADPVAAEAMLLAAVEALRAELEKFIASSR